MLRNLLDAPIRLISRGPAGFFRPVVLLVLLATAVAVQAQGVAPPQWSSQQLAQMGDMLGQGRRLESESRWDEALVLYEKAVRQFPNEPGLKHRFDTTRMHYDVRRRFNDASFRAAIDRLTLEQALGLYEEVLVRIQSHYVESPDWRELVAQGLNNFEVAMSEPAFVERHLKNCPAERIDAARRVLREDLVRRTILNRADAIAAVGDAARTAQRELGISPVAVVFEFNCGATNSLDLYSAYLTPDQLDEIYSQIEGNFVGLGIELKPLDGRLTIVRVIPHSPAEAAGLLANDQILAIDGRNVQEMPNDEAANLLQGKEGSRVELVVAAPGQSPRTIRAQRRRVDVPSIDEVKIVDAQRGIGYLRLTCFQKSTSHDLDDALWQLHRDGMRGGLIMDLRSNPGGLLISAVEAVDKFVAEGVIVSTRGRDPREGFTYSARSPGTWTVPLIVLIDHDSASAAEIFAGAIRDHRRGTIIGQRSYGKGSVQGIFPLHSHSSGIRLTTAKFYSPNGHPFNLVGVTPDRVVQTVARPVDGAIRPEQDATLADALQYARTALSQPTSPSYARVQR
ncbi:MAG TPA: S41 family peptidase [Thermoguttaceae bacterium]|nr:S41 family peptidase [Thermoguttaceae bacterium]